ncbi:MAG: hypothetical protein IKS32_12125 [Solobacterium sp.]|nr:hypothetical protein [Solobacterium sp.]
MKGMDTMDRSKKNYIQMNLTIPAEWKPLLENIARIVSVDEGRSVTVLELIRKAICEKYQLDVSDDDEQ